MDTFVGRKFDCKTSYNNILPHITHLALSQHMHNSTKITTHHMFPHPKHVIINILPSNIQRYDILS